jgi:aryl-alcohol dehydrogenase-like predicted oxidoreductase
MTLKLRKLGKTDIEITPIGLGVMQFAGGAGMFRAMFPKLSQDTMNGIVKTALEAGINWFDTAEMYGHGRSERGLAIALEANGVADADVLVATKWWPFPRTARNIPRTIEDRRHYLNPYTIDLYQVHQPISFSSPEDEADAMADLVESGLIRSVGVSNFSADRMRRAHAALQKRGLPLASNQVQYNLLNRQIETNGILDAAKELGITIIAWGPLSSGILSGKFHKDPGVLNDRPFGRRLRLQRVLDGTRPLIAALDEIADAHQVTVAQVALNWLVHFHGDTVVAIPGASKPHHAQDSAVAMNFILSESEMTHIDDLTRKFR